MRSLDSSTWYAPDVPSEHAILGEHPIYSAADVAAVTFNSVDLSAVALGEGARGGGERTRLA